MARGKIIGGLDDDTRTRFDLLKITHEALLSESVSYDRFVNHIMDLYECIDHTLRDVIRLYNKDDEFKRRLYKLYKEYTDDIKRK